MEISVQELYEAVDNKDAFIALDVREPHELIFAKLDFAENIPLALLLDKEEFPYKKDTKIICICHHGIRSLIAVQYLKEKGYNAYSLKGGIDAWARQIDEKIPRY